MVISCPCGLVISIPFAQSIRKAYGEEINDITLQNYQEVSGHGIIAEVDKQVVLVGNDRLLHRENIPHQAEVCDIEGTIAHLKERSRI